MDTELDIDQVSYGEGTVNSTWPYFSWLLPYIFYITWRV